jgi:hypothetical protein
MNDKRENTESLGDVIAAIFDEAADVDAGATADEVSRLAILVIQRLIRNSDREARLSGSLAAQGAA